MDTKVTTAKAWESEQWEAHIGQQVRRARLEENSSQAQLAERANVALGALKNLEAGRGSTLRTLVRVVRALGLEEWLEELSPDPGISPMAMLRAARDSAPPKRASGSRRERA
ncbi:helix-turn-helix transcriptional regulator [Leucobacter insecticola]|uniref:Helix-turn-helix transcriptional regulator n=1 Tax=Leucobacter insecticola TaxID=2714934 RepID=A0A6G8FJB5_9MICO|nr:helix-turn-helix transcriptional regulator [Leucobacter insecticola]QIM16550.1 helix-turn-helix transcriptional regulator [Leucobacter insecticola]